jgi:hypothetical protein
MPDLVVGIPVERAIRLRNPDIPMARFHENENPYFLPIFTSLIG